MKRLLAILLLFGMLFAVMPAHAAETVIQDGVKVTLITDKDRYEADEWINAQLDIQNTNSYPIKNVRTSIVAPEGYLLLNGSSAEFAELSAGKSYVYKNSMVAAPEKPVVVPQTGDDSHIGLWLFLATLSFTVFCVLMSKNRKAGRMVSMLLCVVLVGTLLPSSVPVRADVFTKTIVVTKQVMVNGQTATVKGTVTYDCEAEPATFKAGDFVCTYDETGKGVTILEYTGEDKDIIVPAVINGLPVTGIAADAFDGHEDITLYVEDDSAAEKFAETMGIPCVVIGSATPTPTVTVTATSTPTPTVAVTPKPTPTWNPTAAWHFEYEIVDGKCIITDYDERVSYLVVPETIEGYPVTEIASSAFSIRESDVELGSSVYINYVVLPETVTVIGSSAFSEQRALYDIWLPNSLTTIGAGAFGCNMGMEQIYIPKNVTSIGNNPFAYMYSFEHSRLKTISVDPENTVFASINGSLVNMQTQTLITYPNAFNKEAYTIPVGVKNIGFAAFRRAELRKVIIPDYVQTIENWAFFGCENLTSLYIPASVKQIADEAIHDWNEDLIIYGIKGSYAETYAKEKGIPFQVLEEVLGEQGPCDGTNHVVAKYTYNRSHPHQFVTICTCGAETPQPFYASGAAYNCCECIGHDWSDMYYVDNQGYAQNCGYCGEMMIITPSQGQFMGYMFEQYRQTSMNDLFERTALNATNKMTEAGFTYINETLNASSDISGTIVEDTMEKISGKKTRNDAMTVEWENLITQMLVSDFTAGDANNADQSTILDGIDTLGPINDGLKIVEDYNKLVKKLNETEGLNLKQIKIEEITQKFADSIELIGEEMSNTIGELLEKAEGSLTEDETNLYNKLLHDQDLLNKLSSSIAKSGKALKNAAKVFSEAFEILDVAVTVFDEYEKQNIYAQIAVLYDEQCRKLNCLTVAAQAMGHEPLIDAIENVYDRLDEQMNNSLMDEVYTFNEVAKNVVMEKICSGVGDVLLEAAPPVKVIEIIGKAADWLLDWDSAYKKGFELQTLGLMNNAIRSEVADIFQDDVDAAYYMSELYTILQIQGMNCSLEYLQAYDTALGLSVEEFGIDNIDDVRETIKTKITNLETAQKSMYDMYVNWYTSAQ